MKKLKMILQYKYFLIFILFIIILVSFIRIKYIKSSYRIDTNKINGILIDKQIDGNKFSFIIKSKEKIKCTYYLTSEEEKNYYENISIGTNLSITGTLNIPSNNSIKNTFNYKKYLLSNNIYIIMDVDNINILNNKINILYKLKNLIYKHINNYKSKDYLYMFIVGNKSFLDTDIYSNYQDAGISHIFAISGMHISILSIIILKLLNFLKENIRYIIVIIFLLIYLFICNYQVSVERSILFFIFIYLNKNLDFNLSIDKVFYITIIFMLLINPVYIYNISFKYSSIVSFTLIKFNKLINGNYIIKLLKVSFISFLVSLPITINTYYEINILSIFNNLLFVPLISLFIYPFSLITFIFPFLDNIYNFFINILNNISSYLLVYKIIIPKFNIIFLILYYLNLYVFFSSKKYKYFFILILLVFINKYKILLDNSFYVEYLDVNQGDAILIRNKNKAYLIDTGGKITYSIDEWKKQSKTYNLSDTYITYFKSIGITKINTLITTHGDTDHMGESINLVNNFKVDKVIFNCGEYNDLENKLIDILNSKNIKYYSCINKLKIDKNNKLIFLNTDVYDNENDNSNVIYFNIYNYKFLFMGDASTTREKDILDKYNLENIDFFKVGHHGSNTSSSSEFISSIMPKYSIISVGKSNRYGHPKDSVLDILEQNSSKIYRTDEDGSIEIKISKNGYKIRICSP